MWIVLCLISLIINLQPYVDADPQVPCYFIFGDSLVDNGNNNDLPTLAKANYFPYGIDFHNGPTGRFTNGRNTVDIIAEFLGFEGEIPPFATARGLGILKGVNYGSGSAGILNETGQHLGGRISFSGQLLNHQITVARISAILGSKYLAKVHLAKCIYTVWMGNNDYLNNYFMPQFYETRNLFTPDQYAEFLVQEYSHQLKVLYNFGARKIGVFALGQIGCIPAMFAMYGGNISSCVEMVNEAAQLFNDRLKLLLDVLNDNLTSANFIYVNTSDTTLDPGFKVEGIPCCKVSLDSGNGQCIPQQIPCSNRDSYRFWDAFHPTDAANLVTGAIAYRAVSPFYTNPIDIW